MNTTLRIWILANGRINSKADLAQVSSGDTGNAKILNTANNIPCIKVTYYNCKNFCRVFEANGEYFVEDIEGVAIKAPHIIINQGVATRSHSLIKNMEIVLKKTVFINQPDSVLLCNDKHFTISLLESMGYKQPLTYFVNSNANILKLSEKFSFPIILKPYTGMHGNGICKISSVDDLIDIMSLVISRDKGKTGHQHILLQEYISTSRGRDVRVIVIGGKCIGAMMRYREDGYFKSNYNSQKGKSKIIPYKISKKVEQMCIDITQKFGLDVAGLDLLFTDKEDEFIVGEVNANPGFVAFEIAHPRIDIAQEIVLHSIAKFNLTFSPV